MQINVAIKYQFQIEISTGNEFQQLCLPSFLPSFLLLSLSFFFYRQRRRFIEMATIRRMRMQADASGCKRMRADAFLINSGLMWQCEISIFFLFGVGSGHLIASIGTGIRRNFQAGKVVEAIAMQNSDEWIHLPPSLFRLPPSAFRISLLLVVLFRQLSYELRPGRFQLDEASTSMAPILLFFHFILKFIISFSFYLFLALFFVEKFSWLQSLSPGQIIQINWNRSMYSEINSIITELFKSH